MDDEIPESQPPEIRIKLLNKLSESIKVDPNLPAQRYVLENYHKYSHHGFLLENSYYRYYNSGDQMIRRANMHLEENQLEDAYIIYLRYSM